ncbi:hypothetical protein ACFWIG_05230 [Corynebacterium bovis]|uniref:hypothetical protein n=1 Tax=Corynebacterium bovis TaxID=36808 RepID=UPI00369163F8
MVAVVGVSRAEGAVVPSPAPAVRGPAPAPTREPATSTAGTMSDPTAESQNRVGKWSRPMSPTSAGATMLPTLMKMR